jgi:glycosyltransferase involved in cell wall biosynthesis
VSRILIWSPNYAPELTGIPPLVTDAAEYLASRGHAVTVATAFPNYPSRRIAPEYRGALWRSERRGAVHVDRSWLRVRPRERLADKALYEASFAALSLPNVLRRFPRADVVVCVVPSFAASLLAAGLVAATRPVARRRFVLWIQDLVLQAALSLEDAGPRARRALAAARRLEPLAPRAADAIVVCSPGFADHLRVLGIPDARVSTVLNWVDTDWIRFVEAQPSRRLRVLYTGNIGYTQGFGTLAAALPLAGVGVDAEVVGDGNAAHEVRRLAEGVPGLTVRPPVERERYPELLESADAFLVIQRDVAAGANLPSKIASYLAAGRPIVASISPDTPAAALLHETGAAVLVPPEDPAALAQALRRVRDEPGLRRELGGAGRAYAVRALDREPALSALERVILG